MKPIDQVATVRFEEGGNTVVSSAGDVSMQLSATIVRTGIQIEVQSGPPRSPVPARVHTGTECTEKESGVRLLAAQDSRDWIPMAIFEATVTVSNNSLTIVFANGVVCSKN